MVIVMVQARSGGVESHAEFGKDVRVGALVEVPERIAGHRLMSNIRRAPQHKVLVVKEICEQYRLNVNS